MRLKTLNEHAQFNDYQYRLKFPNSINNSKSLFINVTLMIICVMMIFDFNI